MGEYHCKPQHSYANVISWSCQENYAQAWVRVWVSDICVCQSSMCSWRETVSYLTSCLVSVSLLNVPGKKKCLYHWIFWWCTDSRMASSGMRCVCMCACLCVSGVLMYVCVDVSIRGAGLGCLLLPSSYHFMGYLWTFKIVNSFGLAIIYETIWHSTDKGKCSGISFWTLKLILCFYKKKITLFNWISSAESPFYMF